MPELPEVETVCRGLAMHAQGKRMIAITVRNPGLRQRIPHNFANALTGSTITTIARRAKYILAHCNDGMTLIIHLGMSGSIVIYTTPPASYQKHDHVILTLSDGSVLVYRDPRRFGLMLLSKTNKLGEHPLLSHLGPEPLFPSWKAEDLYNAVHHRGVSIKTAIMDQETVVGVGNIYASESLFHAKLNPLKSSKSLTLKQCEQLVQSICITLQAAIAAGGSSLRDFAHSNGQLGYFQHTFQVYGRKGQPCHVCGTAILMQTLAQRSTFWCPHCQPAP